MRRRVILLRRLRLGFFWRLFFAGLAWAYRQSTTMFLISLPYLPSNNLPDTLTNVVMNEGMDAEMKASKKEGKEGNERNKIIYKTNLRA